MSATGPSTEAYRIPERRMLDVKHAWPRRKLKQGADEQASESNILPIGARTGNVSAERQSRHRQRSSKLVEVPRSALLGPWDVYSRHRYPTNAEVRTNCHHLAVQTMMRVGI
eukprot:6209462-Pleurochrysis_carterae.AAC.2